jgi:DNA-binding NarL/FixJ family response regulator
MGKKVTDEKLRELHKQRLTSREIAEELNVTESTIRYHLKKLGLKNHLSHEITDTDKIKQLYLKGLTNREIAQKLHITQASVHYWMQQLGLKNNYWKRKGVAT